MKKLLMLILLMSIIIAGNAYSQNGAFMTAQTESPAPAGQPMSAPAGTATSAPAGQYAPATTATTTPGWPAPASSGTTTGGFMAREFSHKDFATMSLKECADCHKGSGVAPTHGSDQMREHSFLARRAGRNCTDCHNQQFCLDCHKGGGIAADLSISNYITSYIPKTHRTDFREIHPIKVLDNPQSCYKCHDVRYCSECHSKFRGEDLMVQSHRRGFSDITAGAGGPAHATFTTAQCQTCHPGGLLPQHQWSSAHAIEARRNLQTCQTCHSDGGVCMTCHSARTGLMVNPHPRGWDSVKGRYKSNSKGKSCSKCHNTF